MRALDIFAGGGGATRGWMTLTEMSEAILPAFSEFIARQWLAGRNQFAARQDGEASDAARRPNRAVEDFDHVLDKMMNSRKRAST